ncbi:MAG: hypothetical protein EOP04_00765 [Proteobacteria bacterium]|nr:MAG: hypothetical protein EOP04_00765 [Pseudomonadota bacterium]
MTRQAVQKRDIVQICIDQLSAEFLHKRALTPRRIISKLVEAFAFSAGLLLFIPQFAYKGTAHAEWVELLSIIVGVLTAILVVVKMIWKVDEESAERLSLIEEGHRVRAEGSRILRNISQENDAVIEGYIQLHKQSSKDAKFFLNVPDKLRQESWRYGLKNLDPVCDQKVCPECQKNPWKYNAPIPGEQFCQMCGTKL